MKVIWRTTLAFLVVVVSLTAATAQKTTQDNLLVGRHRDEVTVTPVNQLLTPAGHQVELPGMRPQAMALSPDGRLLVVSGKTSQLVVIDPGTGEILQRVELPPGTTALSAGRRRLAEHPQSRPPWTSQLYRSGLFRRRQADLHE